MDKGILFKEDSKDAFNKNIFRTLKNKIKREEFCNLNLQPSISPYDIPDAEDILDDFLSNKYYGYMIFGESFMDSKSHCIYRDNNDKLYTFFIYHYSNIQELFGLKELKSK